MACEDELEEYYDAEVVVAGSMVLADVAYAEYMACMAANGGGSGGGSGSGSGESMAPAGETKTEPTPQPAVNRDNLRGYMAIRLKSGDKKQDIVDDLVQMNK